MELTIKKVFGLSLEQVRVHDSEIFPIVLFSLNVLAKMSGYKKRSALLTSWRT